MNKHHLDRSTPACAKCTEVFLCFLTGYIKHIISPSRNIHSRLLFSSLKKRTIIKSGPIGSKSPAHTICHIVYVRQSVQTRTPASTFKCEWSTPIKTSKAAGGVELIVPSPLYSSIFEPDTVSCHKPML